MLQAGEAALSPPSPAAPVGMGGVPGEAKGAPRRRNRSPGPYPLPAHGAQDAASETSFCGARLSLSPRLRPLCQHLWIALSCVNNKAVVRSPLARRGQGGAWGVTFVFLSGSQIAPRPGRAGRVCVVLALGPDRQMCSLGWRQRGDVLLRLAGPRTSEPLGPSGPRLEGTREPKPGSLQAPSPARRRCSGSKEAPPPGPRR